MKIKEVSIQIIKDYYIKPPKENSVTHNGTKSKLLELQNLPYGSGYGYSKYYKEKEPKAMRN